MVLRRNSGIRVKTSHGYDGKPASRADEGEARTALSTEYVSEPRSCWQLERLKEILSFGESERFQSNEQVRRECGPGYFPTPLAVAVVGTFRSLQNLEGDLPAQAAS